MTTCDRCGKTVGTNDWDIHTCTPKPGLCDECETVAHCLKHGCIPKVRSTIDMARKAAAMHGHTFKDVPEQATIEFVTAFEALVRADEREACAKVCESEAEMFKSCAYGANDGRYDWKEDGARECAAAIRARGQA